jgi:uncharacterized membrane protein YfbV (UPF0208 family)
VRVLGRDDAERRWGATHATAALAVYAVVVLFVPLIWGGSLALAPLGAVFATVAWYRDRRSKIRTAALCVTAITLTLIPALLIFRLVWGDLS